MDEDRSDEPRAEPDEAPPARFRRFEKVLITDKKGRVHRGTVLWRDLVEYSPFTPRGFIGVPRRWSQWEYIVELPDFACCPTFEESRLERTGEFDPEEAHLGRRYEISFDTALVEDERVVEGSYRIPGKFWQIFLFRKGDAEGRPVRELRSYFDEWRSGVTGIAFDVPEEDILDRDYILRAFASAFGTDGWVVVRGPDSLLMK